MIKVVNKYKHKPTENDIYIGRPSPLGNPYSHKSNTKAITQVPTREQAIQFYETWLRDRIDMGDKKVINELKKINNDSILVCWCKPNSCHGDIIVKVLKEVGFIND